MCVGMFRDVLQLLLAQEPPEINTCSPLLLEIPSHTWNFSCLVIILGCVFS